MRDGPRHTRTTTSVAIARMNPGYAAQPTASVTAVPATNRCRSPGGSSRANAVSTRSAAAGSTAIAIDRPIRPSENDQSVRAPSP